MYIALIDKNNKVVNVVAPPEGTNVWFVPNGMTAVETEDGAIGDTYQDGTFVKPVVPQEVQQ